MGSTSAAKADLCYLLTAGLKACSTLSMENPFKDCRWLSHRHLNLRQVVPRVATEDHSRALQIDLTAGELRLQPVIVKVSKQPFIALPQFRIRSTEDERDKCSAGKFLNQELAGYSRRSCP